MTVVRLFELGVGMAVLAVLAVPGCASSSGRSSARSTTTPPDAPVRALARAEPTTQLLALRERIGRARADGELTPERCTTWADELIALHVHHGEPYVGARLEAATLLHACGQPSAARARLLEALDPMPRWARAEALNTLGVLAHESGDDGVALVRLQAALHADPALHEARSNLVRLLLRIYDGGGSDFARDDAQHNLDAWLELEPGDPVARLLEARLLMIRARREPATAEAAAAEAELLLQLVLRTGPSPTIAAEASIVAGQLRLAEGDETAALRMFLHALALDPSRSSAALLTATVSLRMRDYDTARRVLEAAAATVDPNDEPERLRLLAVALRGLRRYDDAEAMYERLLSVEEPDPVDLYNRAQLELYQLDLEDGPSTAKRLEHAQAWLGQAIVAMQGRPEHASLAHRAQAERKALEARMLELSQATAPRDIEPEAVELEQQELEQWKHERGRRLELEAKARAAKED